MTVSPLKDLNARDERVRLLRVWAADTELPAYARPSMSVAADHIERDSVNAEIRRTIRAKRDAIAKLRSEIARLEVKMKSEAKAR